MTAVDVTIAVEAHVINMQDAKLSQDAHFYAAEKEIKVGEKDADVTSKGCKSTTPHVIVPETQASADEKSGVKSIALTQPATLSDVGREKSGALSDVGNTTKPPPTTTFVPESQPNEEPLMGGNSTATTPPATLQGALSNVGSKTKETNSIVPQSPAKSTTNSSMPIKSTGYPSGSKLNEILAEKIKQAEKEIQSLQQAVRTQEALKPAVMNAQKPRSHSLNLTFIKNKALKDRIEGKESRLGCNHGL
jgi:hypothetical protein